MARVDFHVATDEGSSTNEVLAYPHAGDAADEFGPRTLPEVRDTVRLEPRIVWLCGPACSGSVTGGAVRP